MDGPTTDHPELRNNLVPKLSLSWHIACATRAFFPCVLYAMEITDKRERGSSTVEFVGIAAAAAVLIGGLGVGLSGQGGAIARGIADAVRGAVTGGGLTVIANAPNPAGQSILAKYFQDGISPLKLFLGALVPTLIVYLCFVFLPSGPAKEHPEENATSPAAPHAPPH